MYTYSNGCEQCDEKWKEEVDDNHNDIVDLDASQVVRQVLCTLVVCVNVFNGHFDNVIASIDWYGQDYG